MGVKCPHCLATLPYHQVGCRLVVMERPRVDMIIAIFTLTFVELPKWLLRKWARSLKP